MSEDPAAVGARVVPTVLRASSVVTPSAVLRGGWVAVAADRIIAVGTGPAVPRDASVVDLGDAVVVPGFVDIHVHGGGGFSFDGRPGDVAAAVAFHRAHGTTTMNASLVSDRLETLRAQVAALVPAVREGLLGGVHLEGPWLAPTRGGAHDPAALRTPTPAEVDDLLAAGAGAVRMVTLAPELQGGLAAVERLVAAGVIVAVGHTEATYEQVRAAQAAGASVATHLFNAMPAVHHRRPGPVPALLDDPATVVELICDGVHLHDAVARMVIGHAGPDRVAVVTDATAAAGLGDGGYRLGRLAVGVRDGVARVAGEGAIAGSTLTMDAAFRRLSGMGVGLVDAARLTATTPARVLGLGNDRGGIAPGLRADLVVLSPTLEVRRVMVAGRWAPDA